MRPILLDTNAYAAFKRGNEEIIEIIRHVEKIGLSPIVLGELLGGFDHGTKSKQNRKELYQFLESSRKGSIICHSRVGGNDMILNQKA